MSGLVFSAYILIPVCMFITAYEHSNSFAEKWDKFSKKLWQN